MTYCPPITTSLLVAVPLAQIPPEIAARLSAVDTPFMQSRAASGTIPGAPALSPPEPHRRLLFLGDETGRIKIFDADAIIGLCNLPSLAEIVSLALEHAQVDKLDHERIEAVGRAARRSSLTIVALQKRRSSVKKMDVSALQDSLAAETAAASAAAAASAGIAQNGSKEEQSRGPVAQGASSAVKQERRHSVSSVAGSVAGDRRRSVSSIDGGATPGAKKQHRATSVQGTRRKSAAQGAEDERDIVHESGSRVSMAPSISHVDLVFESLMHFLCSPR
jgi:hypothetical protein